MEKTVIKITWKAFGDKPDIGRYISSVTFEVPKQVGNPYGICEEIFKQTNTYKGELFEEFIQPLLSGTRTHTALSIGDEVEIDGQVYICGDFGFYKIEEVNIKEIDGYIFSVTKRREVQNV